MKNLPSKEHYCYKIHTLVLKNGTYPHSINNPPIWTIPLPSDFFKNANPL